MIPDQTTRLAVIIPAYKPSAGLIDLVQTLCKKSLPAIVIVDDGSGPEFREIFERVAEFPKVHMLRHAVNLGKGAALKTAFNYFTLRVAGPGRRGDRAMPTASTIRRISSASPQRLLEQPGRAGARRARASAATCRCAAASAISRRAKSCTRCSGQKLTDTQTGLRGIPAALRPA